MSHNMQFLVCLQSLTFLSFTQNKKSVAKLEDDSCESYIKQIG